MSTCPMCWGLGWIIVGIIVCINCCGTGRVSEKCQCGKEATIWAVDPYIEELFPEDEQEEEWWCDECYTERRDSI